MKSSSTFLTRFCFFFIGLSVINLQLAVEALAANHFRVKINPVIPRHFTYPPEQIFGALKWHRVQKEETLLEIAREYGLGYNEIIDLYPELDPWAPPEGKELIVPTRWILPGCSREGIVVNIAEMRLFFLLARENSSRL